MDTPNVIDRAEEAPREAEASDAQLLRATAVGRVVMLILAAAAWALLAVSLSLKPAGEGLGTHEQLGLQPCTFYQMTGQPCPSCGMTTAFALMAHGRVVEAFVAHPFGVVLFLLTVGAAVVLTAAALTGRSLRPMFYSTKIPLAIYGMILLWLAGWGFKLAYGALNGGFAP